MLRVVDVWAFSKLKIYQRREGTRVCGVIGRLIFSAFFPIVFKNFPKNQQYFLKKKTNTKYFLKKRQNLSKIFEKKKFPFFTENLQICIYILFKISRLYV